MTLQKTLYHKNPLFSDVPQSGHQELQIQSDLQSAFIELNMMLPMKATHTKNPLKIPLIISFSTTKNPQKRTSTKHKVPITYTTIKINRLSQNKFL